MTICLAFLPLTDSAPLIVAQELGFFARHGLDVTLSRESSWASVRDKIHTGRVDGAQTLATLPLSLSLGVSHERINLVTGLVLSLNGKAITLSETLYRDLKSTGELRGDSLDGIGRALRTIVQHRRQLGKPRLCFATVYLTSTHSYTLRYWLASIGVLPDVDIRLVVIPPPRMVESLESGLIDGCCVGEPWNHAAVFEGAGRIVLTSSDVWANSPEKVLAVRRDWLDENPAVYQRLAMALIETGAFLDDPANRESVVPVLAQSQYLDLPASVIRHSLVGELVRQPGGERESVPDFHVFHRYSANFPWLSHAEWFLTQMIRWGHVDRSVDVRATAAEVFLPSVFREAAEALGAPCPPDDYKEEGLHGEPYDYGALRLGADRFIDEATFSSTDVERYVHDQWQSDERLLPTRVPSPESKTAPTR